MPGVNSAIINVLKQQCYLAPFSILQVQMVGPKVGAELRTKAVLATLYALGGMLVYIAFRFEWIYGVAAVVACFHDTIITIGLFSLFNKEITLTVIAALLTLVGYSMNDTIVIFDRIRENLKLLRREPLESLINKSVNQTLSRTVMTSGLTFLTVVALIPVRRPGAAWLFFCIGGRYYYRYVLFGFRGQPDRAVLAQLGGRAEEDGSGAGSGRQAATAGAQEFGQGREIGT